MAHTPESNPDPITAAQHTYAQALHESLISGLGASETSQADLEKYKLTLLGYLATDIAGVKLPQDAGASETAAGIAEALRRIVQSPQLMEDVMGAPFDGVITPSDILPKRNREATALQKSVNTAGYFERSMLQPGQMVRMQYAAPASYKPPRRGIKLQPGQAVTIGLVAEADRAWPVEQYNNSYGNPLTGRIEHTGLISTTKVPLTNLFNILSIESNGPVPPELASLQSGIVDIGRVGLGKPLRIAHSHTHALKEVLGYSEGIDNNLLELPVTFQQAYYGHTTTYPLFATGR